ncbi:hypothetical protein [Rhodopirellula halodulae]|uniref:hypothetical protein n=1 Tax=Rhodopirellula halodulae TaxID=2894198 RepID=UPI001E41F884|nr:hypothetical protein [Rhodopirellula sp. JC737]MCC9655600.1 hypothetical protein [Rhodopirellula sp. JC737]
MKFKAETTEAGKLGIAELLTRYANEQWLGEHYTPEQAASLIVDRFRRQVETELAMIELKAEK